MFGVCHAYCYYADTKEQTIGNRLLWLSVNNFMIVYFHKFLEHELKIPKGTVVDVLFLK